MSKNPDFSPEAANDAAPAPTAKRLSPKKMTLALLGGAGVILLSGGTTAYLLHSKIAEQQAVAATKEAQVGSDQQIASRYQTTLETYTDTVKRVQFLESSVSAKSYVPTLLTQLQGLAAATHLTVTAVRPAPPAAAAAPVAVAPAPAAGDAAGVAAARKPAPPPYDTLDISVDVTGTYTDTVAFLYGLTRFPKIISVAGTQMHPESAMNATGAPTTPSVTTNLKLTAYMFKDDAPSSTPAAPTVSASSVVPPVADGSVPGAAGRATKGAVQATRAANSRSQTTLGTL